MILTIVLQHLATTEEMGFFLMGYFHITPVFQSWVVDPPPCLWTFQFCSVFDIFWWFLVSLAICLGGIFPVPFCTHLLLNYFHGLSIKPSFDCLNLRVGSTSTHYMTNIGHWKMIFFLEKVFFFSAKADLDHSFPLVKPVMLRIWPSHLSFDIYFMANNCIRRAS